MKNHDVFSFGMVSSSTLYRISGAFPSPEGYAEIGDVRHMTGGEAANSSIVLSRLGARVKLDGNWIGDDAGGKRTKALLDSYEIDSSRLPMREGYEGAAEVVFAADGTRTIFGTYGRLLDEAHWNIPDESDINSAGVVCLDPFFGEASARAAAIAKAAGIPVVTVDCRYDDPLVRDVSAVVIAESFIRENYPGRPVEDLFRDYQRHSEGLVVFTFGGDATWYGAPGDAIKRFEPYQIEAVDTTGGGDSFRAGIVYGFLQGWDDDRMIEFATAVAALVCARFPGVLEAPTLAEVMDFIGAPRS